MIHYYQRCVSICVYVFVKVVPRLCLVVTAVMSVIVYQEYVTGRQEYVHLKNVKIGGYLQHAVYLWVCLYPYLIENYSYR